ncbi:Cytochrome b2, mitochondrial [Madurella mycetomatis]|uniref:Cytochrome b2, mitochondrial n=1 Tax=Madurella mycetomatis TaxID=100816 RepID=A0A175W645_9PEZI|nr:Cytochrome b2, mitochondrial [Madurella mycetomatis]
MPPTIHPAELSEHNTLTSLWIAVDGVVYDFTEFAPTHPGGLSILLQHGGRDATAAYNAVHSASLVKAILPACKHLGRLQQDSSPELPAKPASQAKPPLSSMISSHDFVQGAHSFLPAKTLAFISSAATDCHTHRRNSTTYAHITLRPRVLVDVSAPVSLATTILGQPVVSPIYVAPTSLGKMVHPEGEKEIARACRKLGGIAQVVSTSASFSVDDVVSAWKEEEKEGGEGDSTRSYSSDSTGSGGGSGSSGSSNSPPVFLQLYVDKNPANTARLLTSPAIRANIKGVFLTVDAPVPGKREADERVPTHTPSPSTSTAVTAPVTTPMARATTPTADSQGAALGRLMASYISPSLTWGETLPWLRTLLPAGVPMVVKGIQTAGDAVRAVRAGARALVLSNHGGRSLDTSPATVLVLLELQRCCPEVFERAEVYIDGGVARGTDVFKALCLGARAVGVGRGVMYALGWGEEGVRRYLQILNDELATTMKMCGVTRLEELHPGLVNTRAVDHLVPETVEEEHPYAKWRKGKL